jgi:hypothetical protein
MVTIGVKKRCITSLALAAVMTAVPILPRLEADTPTRQHMPTVRSPNSVNLSDVRVPLPWEILNIMLTEKQMHRYFGFGNVARNNMKYDHLDCWHGAGVYKLGKGLVTPYLTTPEQAGNWYFLMNDDIMTAQKIAGTLLDRVLKAKIEDARRRAKSFEWTPDTGKLP